MIDVSYKFFGKNIWLKKYNKYNKHELLYLLLIYKNMTENKCFMKLYWITNVWAKWQIVIPKEIRDKLWIESWDSLAILLKDDKYIWIVRNEDLNYLMDYAKSIND